MRILNFPPPFQKDHEFLHEKRFAVDTRFIVQLGAVLICRNTGELVPI